MANSPTVGFTNETALLIAYSILNGVDSLFAREESVMLAMKNMLPTLVVSIVLCVVVMVRPGMAEFPVNTSLGAHETAKVALSAKSGFVVVWRDKTNENIIARQYDKTGTALSGEILVASSGDDEQAPSVCVADDGGFVVAWHNDTAKDIFAQRYDVIGSPVGSVILVTPRPPDINFGFETIFGSSQGNVDDLQIATQVVLSEADTVTSITAYINGRSRDVRYAIYSDNNGEPDVLLNQTSTVAASNGWQWLTIDLPDVALNAGTYWLALAFERVNQLYCYEGAGGQTRIADNDAVANGYLQPWNNTDSSNTRKISIYATMLPPVTDDASPGIGMADDGSFVVAWEEKAAGDVFAQRYDAAGNVLGGQIQVATSADQETTPRVAVADDGSFVVAWANRATNNVFAQRYDGGGNALGGQIQVTSSSDDEETPCICLVADGSFVIAWHNNTAKNIFAQRYDAGGSALGGAIQVTSSTDDEMEPSIGVADDGSFVVAWENNTSQNVLAQRYDSDGSALGTAIQVTTSLDQDKRPSIAVSPRGRFVVVWSNMIDASTENVFGQLYTKDGSAVSEWQAEWRVMKWVEITAP